MSYENDGGQAFPSTRGDWKDTEDSGMSLRDYFAAKAMQSLIGNGVVTEGAFWKEKLPVLAYEMADSMLKARQG